MCERDRFFLVLVLDERAELALLGQEGGADKRLK